MGMGQNDKLKPPGTGPQVLVHVSICQGHPFWGYPIFDNHSHICLWFRVRLCTSKGVSHKFDTFSFVYWGPGLFVGGPYPWGGSEQGYDKKMVSWFLSAVGLGNDFKAGNALFFSRRHKRKWREVIQLPRPSK